jgi:hypothetical protein
MKRNLLTMSKTMREWLSKRRQELSYQIFGPTTLHLQHEFYLWISLILLEISSFQALQHRDDSIGFLMGDYQFIALVALWLSRFMLLRWATTWDPSNSLRPTFLGVCTHWITSHIMAGQYFDRPSPDVVAKQMGTQHYHGNFENRHAGGTRAAIRDLLWPSFVYTWRYIKSIVLYPLLDLRNENWRRNMQMTSYDNASASSKSSQLSSHRRHKRRNSGGNTNSLAAVSSTRTPSYYASHFSRIWKNYGPPLQMIIPIVTLAYFVYHGFFMDNEEEPPNALTMQTQSSASGPTVAGPLTTGIGANVKAYGAYKQRQLPTWSQILSYISFGGTVLSIILYGRIVFPIPDLVAGSNVLKAMRNEAKHYQQQQASATTVSRTLLFRLMRYSYCQRKCVYH